MQSHEDRDFHITDDPNWPDMPADKLEELNVKAAELMADQRSTITAGKPGEKPIKAYEYNGMRVTKMPADETTVLRVSVGGGYKEANYCVYRGSRDACVALLEEALAALRAG